jgi:ribosomal protein L29
MQTVDTHRAELRELSELHYARVDSRMTELRQVTDARFGELRHELRADITTLRMETQAGLAEVRDEMRAGFAEAKVTSAGLEAKIDRRFAEFVKWSFLFWCGAIAAAALARI